MAISSMAREGVRRMPDGPGAAGTPAGSGISAETAASAGALPPRHEAAVNRYGRVRRKAKRGFLVLSGLLRLGAALVVFGVGTAFGILLLLEIFGDRLEI